MAKGDTTKARQVLLSKRSKYEDAFQCKVLNPDISTQKLAEMFEVDRSGLHKYIKAKMSEEDSTSGIHKAKNAVMDIKGGLDILKNLQESTNQRDVEISQKAIKSLEEYYPEMKSVFASIQNRVLNALDRETQRMEQVGEMDLMGIAKTQAVLKMVNDTNHFNPKTPMVAVQNNINNQNANIGSPQSKKQTSNKEIRFITISTKDDLKEAQHFVEGEVIE